MREEWSMSELSKNVQWKLGGQRLESYQCAYVDEEVEVMVYSALSDCWVKDDSLTTRKCADDKLLERYSAEELASSPKKLTGTLLWQRKTKSWGSYCSAIKGEILDLKEPVPTPMMINPIMKVASEFLEWMMTGGTAETTRMIWPMIAIAKA